MDRPLRIAIDARIPEGLYGGVQQWVLGLANALSQLDSETEEYLFLVDQGQGDWLRPYLSGPCRLLPRQRRPLMRRGAGRARTWIRRVRAWTARSLPTLARRGEGATRRPFRPSIPRSDGTIERAGADVMHFTMQIGFLTTVPSLYQPWDLQHLHLPEFFTPEQQAWRELTYRGFCAQATLIVAASQWVKRDLVAQYGLVPDHIAVVNVPPPTAVYRDPTPIETSAIAARLGLPDRFVYYPAQTWPHKNHQRLFAALAFLREEGHVVPLVCSGHLNERSAEIADAASRLGIADQVHFVGYLEPIEIQVLYRTARALVFPSLYEGWGLPIMEAFSNGLPVACSDVTSIPELVGDAALVFDPYDPRSIAAAVQRLWTDDALAVELARRGRAVAGRYDWDRTARIMRAHYRRTAGQILNEADVALLAHAPTV